MQWTFIIIRGQYFLETILKVSTAVFFVSFQQQEEKAKSKPISFTITPETLTNIKEVCHYICTHFVSLKLQLFMERSGLVGRALDWGLKGC